MPKSRPTAGGAYQRRRRRSNRRNDSPHKEAGAALAAQPLFPRTKHSYRSRDADKQSLMLPPVTARNADASSLMSLNRGCFDDYHDQMDFVRGCCNSGLPNLLFVNAAESAGDRAPTRSVKVWDLDLSDSQDVQALYQRVQAAATDVCQSAARRHWRETRDAAPIGWTPALRSGRRRWGRARLRQSAARRAAHTDRSGAQRLTVRRAKRADAVGRPHATLLQIAEIRLRRQTAELLEQPQQLIAFAQTETAAQVFLEPSMQVEQPNGELDTGRR